MGSYNDEIALHRRPVRASHLLSPGSVASSKRMPSSVIRLLLVTDYPVMRHGLRQILGGATDIRIVGEARGVVNSVEQAGACHPDAVLLDFAGKASYEVFCQLQKHHGHLPILIFSTAHDRYAKKAFQRGAMGYVTKDHVPDHLVLAIRRMSCGEKYVWPSIVLGWREQFSAVVTALVTSIVKVWNPLAFTSDRSSSH